VIVKLKIKKYLTHLYINKKMRGKKLKQSTSKERNKIKKQEITAEKESIIQNTEVETSEKDKNTYVKVL